MMCKKQNQSFQNDAVVGVANFITIEQTQNQHIEKNRHDDSLSASRYMVTAVPSKLRPIKSWVIRVEQCFYDMMGQAEKSSIFEVEIANIADMTCGAVSRISINGGDVDANENQSFHALMAINTMISKVDSRQSPNIDKILSLHGLSSPVLGLIQ
jgi:hypothetical protein